MPRRRETSAIVGKYKRLIKTLKEARVGTDCIVGDITNNGRQG